MKQKQSFIASFALLFVLLNLLVSISSTPMIKVTTETSSFSISEHDFSLLEMALKDKNFKSPRDFKIVEKNPALETQTASGHQPLAELDSSKSEGLAAPILSKNQLPNIQLSTNHRLMKSHCRIDTRFDSMPMTDMEILQDKIQKSVNVIPSTKYEK
ncbi:hypothetical protein BY996DRAFT_6765607 [Phakopsora pachyrhizi]|nr:hypothetical protein BY996DRAFT_6765607 [Phakopsora pachyrhizi]